MANRVGAGKGRESFSRKTVILFLQSGLKPAKPFDIPNIYCRFAYKVTYQRTLHHEAGFAEYAGVD
jgi:hypothetical protein